MLNIQPRQAALLLLLAMLWGSAFVLIKIAVGSISPSLAALGRVTVGCVVVLGALMWIRKPVGLAPKAWLKLFALGLFGVALPFYFQNVAETQIPSSHASILMGTVPLFTLVIAHFATNEKISPKLLVGFLVAFAGVVCLIGPHAMASGSQFTFFHILILLAALSYALNLVLSRRIVDIPVENMTFGMLAWGGLLLFFLAFSQGGAAMPVPSGESLFAVLLLGLGSTAGAALLTMHLVRSAGAQPVALAVNLIPVIGVLLGAVVLREYPSSGEISAVLLILLGVYIGAYAPPLRLFQSKRAR